MKRKIHISKRFVRRVITVCVVLGCVWVIYTQIGQAVLRPIARKRLEELTGTAVQINEMKFKISGHVSIDFLGIGSGRRGDYDSRVLKAKTVNVWFSPWSLLIFKPEIRRITFKDFFINIQYDEDADIWNLGVLDFEGVSSGKQRIPIIRAERGFVKYSVVRGGKADDVVMAGFDGTLSHAKGAKNAYGFALRMNPKLAFGGSELRGVWYAGREGRVELLNGRISTEQDPVLGNDWDIGSLRGLIEYDEKDIRNISLDIALTQGTEAVFTGRLLDYRTDPSFELEIHAQNMHLDRVTKKNSLVYSEEALDILSADLRNFLQQYEPVGWGNVNVEASGQLKDLAQSRWRGTIDCWDVVMQDKNFPYALQDLKGELVITEEGSRFDLLTCRHRDVDLTISGYAYGGGDDWDCDVRIESPNMLLDDDLYRALNEKQKLMWLTFAPEGRVKIGYHFQVKPGQEREDRLEVELDDTRAVYLHFPYQLQNLSGHLTVDPDAIQLEDVHSSYSHPDGDYGITLNGNVNDIESERPRFNIVIDANNVPIDDALMDALPARHRDFYENFEVNARTDAKIKVFPNEVGRRLVEYIAWVKVRDASLLYEKLPLPLEHVDADAVLTPDLVILEKVTGRRGQGQLSLSGKVWPVNEYNDQTGYCLHARAEELELEEDMFWALPQIGWKVFSKLRATGKVNVDADLNLHARGDDCAPYRVQVECLGNDLTYEKFAYPIENMTGTITVAEGKVELKEMRSTLPADSDHPWEQQIYLDGTVTMDGNDIDAGQFTLTARDVKLDERLLKAVSLSEDDSYAAVNPSGRVDVDIEKLRLSRESEQMLVDFAGNLILKQCSLGEKGAVTDLTGMIRASGQHRQGQGFTEAQADFRAEQFRVKQKLIENLAGSVTFDPQQRRFVNNRFFATCYGGDMFGRFYVSEPTNEGMEYMAEVFFEDIDLHEVYEDQQEEQLSSRGYAQGVIDGSFTISGQTGEKNQRVGRLSAGIRDMLFGKRSLPGRVVEAARSENKKVDLSFRDVNIESYLRGDELVFEEVFMAGKSAVLQGRGVMDLGRNTVDLKFTAFGQKMTEEPGFLESLAAGLGPGLVQVNVTGDLDTPEVETRTLNLIRSPVDILGPEAKKER